MFLVRVFIVFFILILSSGCSYLYKPSFMQNRDQAYLSARSIPPLKIPPGISSDQFHNDYPVSSREYREEDKRVSIVPPGLSS